MHSLLKSKLAIKQAKNIMTFAVTLGLLLSTLQITVDIFADRDRVKSDVEQILSMFNEPVIRAILDVDDGLAQTVVAALLEYKALVHARIIDAHQITIAKQTRPLIVTDMRWLTDYLFAESKYFEVAVFDPGSKTAIGKIEVNLDSSVIASRVFTRAKFIITGGLVRNSLLSLIFLIIFYLTLTKPLLTMIHRVSSADSENPQNSMLEIPSQHDKDELGILVTMINQLLGRFGDTLEQHNHIERELRQDRSHLEVIVAARTQELEDKNRALEASFKQLVKLEKTKSIAEERSRIMRDMHDGIGGQLVSTLAMTDNADYSRDDIAATIGAAITDLRLIIDSLDSSGDDLNMLLGMFRSRIQQQLDSHNITISWQVQDISGAYGFGAEARLHLVRILQESITNTIKHSNADQLILKAYEVIDQSPGIMIELIDNGGGFSVENQPVGRGLVNMRFRANQINAQLHVNSLLTGTQTQLFLPQSKTQNDLELIA